MNALKADVYLWTAKRLNGGTADLNEVLAAVQEVENSDVELLSDYSSIFDIANKGNSEIIMCVRFEQGESPTRSVYGGVTGINAPTFPLTDQETIDKVFPFAGKNVYWQVSTAVSDQFHEDDQRKDATLISVYQTQDGVRSFLYNVDQKWTGIINGSVREMYDDYFLYQYADIILMKAEAKNALGMDPSDEINQIRQRAYGDAFENYRYVHTSQESGDETILQERLFEFIQEARDGGILSGLAKHWRLFLYFRGKTKTIFYFLSAKPY